MIKSDSLDHITLDSADIQSIERFENNYYNHKNNLLQNGGNIQKLEKNIARLYNCYVLSQNQNQYELSSKIKRRLNKKITELNELEGGGYFITIKEFLKKKIKNRIEEKIIPFIEEKIEKIDIKKQIITLINNQNLNETIVNIIEEYIKPYIINFIEDQNINVTKITQNCVFGLCLTVFGITDDDNGKIVKDYLIQQINNLIIPYIQEKLDKTDINNIIVKLVETRDLKNDIKNILNNYIKPNVINYIDNINFTNDLDSDIDGGGLFGKKLEEKLEEKLEDYLKNKMKITIKYIIDNIKEILNNTDINTKITEFIKNQKLNETIINIIITYIIPKIKLFILENIDVSQKIGISSDAGKKVIKYLIDIIDTKIQNFITKKINVFDINKIAIEFVNEQNFQYNIETILVEYIEPQINIYIDDSSFVHDIKIFVNKYFENNKRIVIERNNKRLTSYHVKNKFLI
jgi:hypothetical protein